MRLEILHQLAVNVGNNNIVFATKALEGIERGAAVLGSATAVEQTEAADKRIHKGE